MLKLNLWTTVLEGILNLIDYEYIYTLVSSFKCIILYDDPVCIRKLYPNAHVLLYIYIHDSTVFPPRTLLEPSKSRKLLLIN